MDDGAGIRGRLTTAARVAENSGADEDLHAYWALVEEVVEGASAETVAHCASELLGSAGVLEREAGCDLAGRAAEAHESLRGGAAMSLMALAGVETERRVLSSLVHALGRTRDPRAVPVLVRLSGHEDAGLRRDVASEFASVDSGLPDGPDVRALIRLTGDQDPEVRAWAAFTLGFQLEQDTAAIRDALRTCTTDTHGAVREEGARGLARRHDPRAVPLIAHLLDSDDGSCLFLVDAAAILGVPELLPALAAYGPDPAGAEWAAAACDPVRRVRMEADAWAVVVELERLRPDLGAALRSPRYESVHALKVSHRESAGTEYDAAALLARAGGDPVRAAALVVADLAGPAAGGSRTGGLPGSPA